jgi:hypothetical protein
MKYKLRFFLDCEDPDDQFCFATVTSSHVPGVNSRIFLGDESIVDQRVEMSTVFKVKERVFCYNNYGKEDDLSSVEITVTRYRK